MDDEHGVSPRTRAAGGGGRLLPLLALLLFVSGSAALVYEIVWLHLLQLVVGSSAVSLGILLGTFMGGMCLGSLLLPRLVAARRNPLRVLAALEFAVGVMGVALLFAIPEVGRLYTAWIGRGLPGLLLRGAVAGACLLPPTMLMGATLPAIARGLSANRRGVAQLGFLYAANIAGAVFGCLLAGFYLLRVHDVVIATAAAALGNAVVGIVALGFASRLPAAPLSRARPLPPTPRRVGAGRVHVVIALSGLTALGAEVVWTRLLSLLLGATVYAFSIILAVFLLGLGIGSGLGARLAERVRRPAWSLGVVQLLLALAIFLSARLLTVSVPQWPVDPSLGTDPWISFQLDLARTAWAILLPTLLWGASFPLALAAAAGRGGDAGRIVGGVYAANTVGAILGALGFSLGIVAWVGTRGAQQLLVATAGAAGLFVLVPDLWAAGRLRGTGKPVLGAGVGAAVVGVAILVASVPPTPAALIGYGRYLLTWDPLPRFDYVAEGVTASIAVSTTSDGVQSFHVSGKTVASTESQDMRLQHMMAHVPVLLHPKPRSVLVVGCGAGITAGAIALHPEIERIVVCEIEPLIPPAAARYFGDANHHVLDDPRVEVVCDDARHYVRTCRDRFDVITSDPIHPWVKGAAALYSLDYYEQCKQHLAPGGVVAQWVPLYETTRAAVRSELATFFAALPDGIVWGNDKEGEGYDLVVMGPAPASRIDLDALQARLDLPGNAPVKDALDAVGLGSALRLLSTYTGRGPDLAPWLRGAQINRDVNLRLQYLAGLGANLYQESRIFDAMLAYRRYPEDLFDEGGEAGARLRTRIEDGPFRR